ncbi:MAG: hypothetical protein ACFFEE_07360 [Candidatus Thorarchaeota archaeon]
MSKKLIVPTSLFKKIIRKVLKDDDYLAALAADPQAAIGYDWKYLSPSEKTFLGSLQSNAQKVAAMRSSVDDLKLAINTTKPSTWI